MSNVQRSDVIISGGGLVGQIHGETDHAGQRIRRDDPRRHAPPSNGATQRGGKGKQGKYEHGELLMRGNFKCMPARQRCPTIPHGSTAPVADLPSLCDICLLNKIKFPP